MPTASRGSKRVDECDSGFYRPHCAKQKPKAQAKAQPAKNAKCQGQTLERRTIPVEPASWRADSSVSDRPLPRFYLHDTGGADFSAVSSELRERIGSGLAEETVPVSLSQYLVDMPVIESLRTHPRRVSKPEGAEWHILSAMPLASRLLALLHANVTADSGHVCNRQSVCHALPHGFGPELREHTDRLSRQLAYLRGDTHWRTPKVPFLLLSTGININEELPTEFIRELVRRDARVGPVLLAGVDRSGPHAMAVANLPLLRRMIILPHVASPECTRYAGRIAAPRHVRSHARKSAPDGTDRRATSSASASAAVTSSSTSSTSSSAAPGSLHAADAASSSRHGFLFHGHNGRFDNGARAAVRDIGSNLRAGYDFQMLRLQTVGGADNSSYAATHRVHRLVSQHTTRRMLNASMCFAPQGDSDSSRRLFDALATGCVPIIVKVIGGRPRETMLTNLPFHHTIKWAGVSRLLAAAGASLNDRFAPASGWKMTCRIAEAAQLDGWHDDAHMLELMRSNAVSAFRASLDVEGNPRGVANALLRELAYVLTDLPHTFYLPPPHLVPSGMRAWPNMTEKQWLWTK